MKPKKIYPLGDRVTWQEMNSLGTDLGGVPFLSRQNARKNVKAVTTGEKRCPKAGEWYISGAIVEAYRADHDLNTEFFIAKLVMTKTTVITTVEIVE